uniref:Immunoglobulin subtype domain-containing protein n=1 Tax=Xiphophorus couchianus TaxID=32473 RepID=A0A3B5KJL5_9TELE
MKLRWLLDITCKTYFTFSLFLPGSENVKTITKVSVKMGATVSIPCSYDLKYKDHMKYLCKGFYWNSCSYEITTDSPRETGKYSISDDKTQRIFTVTIKQLTADSYYWCIVDIKNGGDDGEAVNSGTLCFPSQHINKYLPIVPLSTTRQETGTKS